MSSFDDIMMKVATSCRYRIVPAANFPRSRVDGSQLSRTSAALSLTFDRPKIETAPSATTTARTSPNAAMTLVLMDRFCNLDMGAPLAENLRLPFGWNGDG